MSAREMLKMCQKLCRRGVEMYRTHMREQIKLDVPFGVELDIENRWVKLAAIMPWDKIDELYAKNFKGASGQIAKDSRLAFGALYIQQRLAITDEETVAQISENPAMQYFCGFDIYTIQKPFDASLMVHFRKRITPEMLKEISEEAFAKQARKVIEADEKTKKDNDDNDNPPKGTLIIDATCCPSDIRYPTDVGLLNQARELTEQAIDILHKMYAGKGMIKPRTYRKVARRAYLSYVKKRRHTKMELRFVMRKLLQCVRRNLESITKQVGMGANLESVGNELYQKLQVVSELYIQQKEMFDAQINTVSNRIVSISQPHLRPIVRGKVGKSVEFGAKVATANIGGFTFIIHLDYDNFSEGKYLKASVEEYKRMFGFYPAVVLGDKAYSTNENRNYCKSKSIRLSGLRRGRKTEEIKKEEQKQIYQDSCNRNAIEGSYGVVKRKYGLDLIMTKLYETTLTAISMGFFVKNMERVLRLFVLRLSMILTYYGIRPLSFFPIQ
jgi:hypothetical protein